MKKCVQLLYELGMGGAETVVKDYSLHFDAKIDNTILCLKRKNLPYERILESAGVQIIYVSDFMPFYGKKGLICKFLNTIHRYYYTKKILRKINPDIVHSHLPINTYLRFANLSKNTTLFHTVHSEPKKYWNKNNVFNILEFNATSSLIRKHNMKIIALHSKMKKQIDSLFNINNTLILKNGIDFDRFENAKDRHAVRKSLGIPTDAFVVGNVGRFLKVKNHSFIIEVFEKINDKNKDAFLLLVGDGPLKKDIEIKIILANLKDKCIILSNRTDIPDLLNAMDVFLFPSLYEGLPVSLIEAQKMNCMCFVSDKITKEVIVSNLVEICSLDDNANVWAQRILQYKFKEVQERGMGDWDIKNVVNKLETFYLEYSQETSYEKNTYKIR